MITIGISDGLGNQIYQYVCGYVSAKMNNDHLQLDTSDCDNSLLRSYMLDNFNINKCPRKSLPNKNFFQKA